MGKGKGSSGGAVTKSLSSSETAVRVGHTSFVKSMFKAGSGFNEGIVLPGYNCRDLRLVICSSV